MFSRPESSLFPSITFHRHQKIPCTLPLSTVKNVTRFSVVWLEKIQENKRKKIVKCLPHVNGENIGLKRDKDKTTQHKSDHLLLDGDGDDGDLATWLS